MSDRCKAKNAQGEPCSAAVYKDGYCRWHSPDPGVRQAVSEGRAKGGRARSNARRARKALPAEPMSPQELESWLGLVFRNVIGGKIEPGVGTAAANIARALLEVAKVASFDSQLAEMQGEIAQLKASAA